MKLLQNCWSKILQDFEQSINQSIFSLQVEDQMKLLQNCWSEILILDLAHRFLKRIWGGELHLVSTYFSKSLIPSPLACALANMGILMPLNSMPRSNLGVKG